MKDLLLKLGRRIHELRTAKEWSQEEFAHVSGFHRTYIGQIERGEKNLSFSNLSKLSSVFGLTIAQLLAGLEDGTDAAGPDAVAKKKGGNPARQMFEIRKLTRRLTVQTGAMDRTVAALEKLTADGAVSKRVSNRTATPKRLAR